LRKGDMLLQGYMKSISGNTVGQGSHLPYAGRALVVRAQEGSQSMEWETEAAPADIKQSYVTYVWIAGESGITYGKTPAGVDLYVDGQKKFTITTGSLNAWSKKAADGSELSFRPMMKTRAEDLTGYMYLRIPRKQVPAGRSLQLKMTASNAGTDSWCMVFESPIKSDIQVTQRPAVLKNPDKNLQPVFVEIHYFGTPATAKITLEGNSRQVPLTLGYNVVDMSVEAGEQARTSTVEVLVGGQTEKRDVTIQPVRNWKVNFVQHTHTDIGYTRSQTEILSEHVRFIDYALDYCDATDSWPDDAKFRWTCEAAWAVSEYLNNRPKEQIERLKKRVAEGRIEIAAMYFNFDEMPDEQTLAASLSPIKQIRKAGLKTEMAMQNDVNGIGWCFSEFFPDMGIKYVNMGTHGHKALISFDKPTAFWWESPSGKKTLTFRAEHYMYGNFMGIEKDDFDFFESKVFEYLHKMSTMDYPFDMISLQYSGYYTDNSPPAMAGPALIRKWNEKYEWPKMRSAVATDFFREIERKHGNQLTSIRGAWPDWWNDGFGSGAREAATSRLAHSDIIANQTALSMAKMLGAELPRDITGKINAVNEALLFYDEHTFGYHASISDPFGKYTMEQRSLKMSYAWEAYRRSRPICETALGLLQMYIPRAETPSIAVFNPHNRAHDGLAKAYIDHEILPRNRKVEIVDETGRPIPAQAVESHSDGTYWAFWVSNLPALGYRQYFIRVKNEPAVTQATSAELKQTAIENKWYKIALDPDRGTIASLFDKDMNREILMSGAEWQLGEFVHEQLENRRDMDAFRRPKATRTGLEKVWFERCEEGDIWDTWIFRGETSTGIGAKNYLFEIRLFKTAKRIDFVHRLRKKQVTDPESIYISFPFTLPEGKIFYDVPGGVIEAGVDQIPGSANDWNTVQNFASVRSRDGQIVMGSPEIPLIQFGGFNCGRFQANAVPETTAMYSWPMNNYWTTNFNADQHGEFEWTYFMTSSEDSSIEYATRFAWGSRIPLPTRVVPAGKTDTRHMKSENAVLEIVPENILLVNMRPVENEPAVVLQLREIGGKQTLFDARSPAGKKLHFEVCDANADVTDSKTPIMLNPWENKFIKLRWE
ncbi:MAG: glycosyl hydrolase family 38, partial [Tannerella sp.]|nr:glycosyl hydrolase family 38 [Tannerella sp.]